MASEIPVLDNRLSLLQAWNVAQRDGYRCEAEKKKKPSPLEPSCASGDKYAVTT